MVKTLVPYPDTYESFVPCQRLFTPPPSVKVSVVAVATTVTVWFGTFILTFSVLPLSLNVE